ncbi:MAG: hypothetical protein ABI675_09055 [Chitinophagaceae bacterium]
MMRPFIRITFIILSLTCFSIPPQAQPVNTAVVKENEKNNKPYRILTSGKLVTIKSTKTIKNVMVWTSGGNRIIEDKNVNVSSYNFRITVDEKIFFIMVQLVDGKTYSEKIGVQ